MLKRVVVTRSFQAMIRRRGSAGLRVKSQSAIGRAAIGCGPRSLPSLYVQHENQLKERTKDLVENMTNKKRKACCPKF